MMNKRFTSIMALLTAMLLTLPVQGGNRKAHYTAPSTQSYTYTFDTDTEGWTTIDADGDGHTWEQGDNGIWGHDAGENYDNKAMTSKSWDSQAGPLHPDNYLVSPKIKLNGKITFWACTQDKSYPAEHFGVAVSTASNTDAKDFTMITDEWEMMASRGSQWFGSRRRVQGTWYKYEVDLNSYNGVEGYVPTTPRPRNSLKPPVTSMRTTVMKV